MTMSWADFGERVASARRDVGLTQQELAARLSLDRTSVTKIEAGQRTVDSLELARIAEVLERPIDWFVMEPVPSVVSRRAERDVAQREDIRLESLARDVEQLIELKVLTPPAHREPPTIESPTDAEAAALDARRRAGVIDGEPVWDLVRVVERLGLYAFVLTLDQKDLDGTYVALNKGGVALIEGRAEPGRRRFTLVHELGHHCLADEFATEWVVGDGESEKRINWFAIHFLMPRLGVEKAWARYQGPDDHRDAALRIAAEFGVSWSAACAQLRNLHMVTESQHDELVCARPTRFDYLERELSFRVDLEPPLVPPSYAAAVVRALRRRKIGRRRAEEMLHGTLAMADLPPERDLPIEALSADLEPVRRG